MAVSKVKQERIQLDLVVPQARNEELRRGLRNQPWNHETEKQECATPPSVIGNHGCCDPCHVREA